MKIFYEIGYSTHKALAHEMSSGRASDLEIAALHRLLDFKGERIDVERLAPVAKNAGLPWEEMFPDIYGQPSPSGE